MPGGIVCSVAICKSNSKKAKESGADLIFFSFPKDPVIRKEWVRKCYRKDELRPENKRICSLHFKAEDYEDEMQARLMGIRPKKLKKTAIPSLLLRPSDKKRESAEAKVSERTKRFQRKEAKQLLDELIQNPSTSGQSTEQFHEEMEESTELTISKITSSSTENEAEILKRELALLQQENSLLKEKIQLHVTSEETLRHNILELEKQLKEEGDRFEEKVKLAFKEFLTSNQVEIALKKKTKARWTTEELSRAFTLRYFSKRCYIYLRDTLHYPLPGVSTLQQWAANINLRSGVLEDVLRIMNSAGKSKNRINRCTVLSFDEIKVSALYEYDAKEDEVLGPHSYMQVIMARGLFDKWKQPVYIGFDQKVTKSLLENIITRLHEINYNVVACTSDCGGGNQGLWRQLNITTDNTSIEHPVTKNNVYFFADVPHLLKLLRNWFVDTGFMLKSGVMLHKKPVQQLIDSTRTEISSCHKLTPLHINCEKAQRQNVEVGSWQRNYYRTPQPQL